MPIQMDSNKAFELSFKSFDEALAEPRSNFVITKDLKLINKRSLSWKILFLFKPFYRLFGWDIYHHVRADRVAQGIIHYCQNYRDLLNARPLLIEKIRRQILLRLKEKTHAKYDTEIDRAISELNTMIRRTDEQTRPEPINEAFLNPLNTIEDNFNLTNERIQWPDEECLRTLEISEADLLAIRGPLERGFQQLIMNPAHYDLNFVKTTQKRSLQLINLDVWEEKGNIISEARIPFSLEIVRSSDKKITDIIILAKKVLAQGGQTKVRLCFSTFRNMLLVRKSCESETQKLIIEHFRKCPTRGITPIFHLRTRNNKKMQVIEPLLKVLDQLAHTLTDTDKVSIAQDLLYGIRAVHRLNEAHRDIKPSNILIEKINGVWRGFITDFGFADRSFIGGSLLYRSPEQIAVDKENIKYKLTRSSPYYDRINRLPELSQPGDMWSMGLVLFSLFITRISDSRIGYPRFMWDKIFPLPSSSLPCVQIDPKNEIKDIKVLEDLSQEEIDLAVSQFKYYMLNVSTLNVSETEKWCHLIERMIRKRPEARLSSEAVVTGFIT
ncbi:MAG: hypothetical protein H0V82_06445 [Candidatus Protochlamydia sp.]|nr:hypothetical protein [Candidatus Protochlamydia sp.]